jgi:hypothetical protein
MKTYFQQHKWQLGLFALIVIATVFNLVPHDVIAGGGLVMLAGSTTITQAFVQQFDSTIRQQAQQRTSRFESRVLDRGNIVGESFTANRLGVAEDTPENTSRHGDTVWSDIEHSTRVALMRDFYQALPVDRADEPKVLANPTGDYMNSLLAAWNRRKDGIIYAAALGNSQTKEGALIALPAGQKIAAGAAGFNKAKILTAKKIFRANECDSESDDPQELYMTYTAEMLEDILSDATLTSADFMAVKMLQEGNVAGKWMGFNWVPYERVNNVAGTYSAVAWAKSAIHFGTGFFEGKSQRRGDKKDTMQVSAAGSVGAARVWEYGVVQIDFV